MKMKNPHDKFFKATFSNVEVVQDFIIHFVPPSIKDLIDLSAITLEKDSFIDEKLQETYSDLLFKTKIKNHPAYLYFLFEHKSYLSPGISLQLLQYMIEIWIDKGKSSDRLPLVMPIVIYHGEKDWTIPASLGDLIEGYHDFPDSVQKYVPNFDYFLYDVTHYQDDNDNLNVKLRILFRLFRDIRKQNSTELLNTIYLAFDLLKQLENQEAAIQFLETIMLYIFHANQQLTKDYFHDMIRYVENNYSEGSETVMTLAEIFREEGKREGKRVGKQEGKKLSLISTSIKLITKFVAPVSEELIEKIKQQDIATLDTLIDRIDEWKNIEQIEQYLK